LYHHSALPPFLLFYLFFLSIASSPTYFFGHHLFSLLLSPCQVTVDSSLPLGAGLGSSASYSACIAAGFFRLITATDTIFGNDEGETVALSDNDKEVINRWAFEGERIIHGNPSGVDNTVIVFGGVMSYRKAATGNVMQRLDTLPAGIRFVVTNTKVERNTKQLVAGVGALLKRFPDTVRPVLASLDAMAAEQVTS
jgi:mevalonate kinase